jgi:uncharacterized protein (TIGR03067 family)
MRTFLLVLAAAGLGFAPAPLPRSDRGRVERPRLFGTWTLKQVRYLGTTNYGGAGAGTGIIYLKDEVTITDREMRVQSGDPNRLPREQRLAIEVQTGTSHLDFLQGQDRRASGLYRVEGTKLTIAYPVGTGRPRPTSFDNQSDIVLVLERVR